MAKKPTLPAFLRASARPITRPAKPNARALWCARCSAWKAPDGFAPSQRTEREDLRACSECQAKARARFNQKRAARMAVERAFPAEEIVGAQERIKAATGGALRGIRLEIAANALLKVLPGEPCCVCGGALGEHYRVLPGRNVPPFALACFICFSIIRSGMDRTTLELHYAEIRRRAVDSSGEDRDRDYAASGA